MRNQLAKEIKRKFGPIYGSGELKTVRTELIANAQERFDDEIQNGMTEHAAYEIALSSVGDCGELRKEESLSNAKKRYKIICFAVVGAIVLSILIPIGILLIEAYAFLRWIVIVPFCMTAIALFLIAFGTLRLLLHQPKKPLSIVFIAIGSFVLELSLIVVLIFASINYSLRHPDYYDYSDRINNIESIAYVECTSDNRNNMQYKELKTLSPDRYEALLKELAALEYHDYFGSPKYINKGTDLILIRFSTVEEDGAVCVFYGDFAAGRGIKASGANFTAKQDIKACGTNEWDAIVKKYFP